MVALTIDTLGGGLPVDGQKTRSEYFIKGTEPNGPAAMYQKVKMSKHDQGKSGSPWEVEHNDYDTADYIVFHEDDPVSTDGKNLWQDGINEWLKDQYKGDENKKYHPPTETSGYSQEGGSNNNDNQTPTPSPTPTVTPTP